LTPVVIRQTTGGKSDEEDTCNVVGSGGGTHTALTEIVKAPERISNNVDAHQREEEEWDWKGSHTALIGIVICQEKKISNNIDAHQYEEDICT
jgi:hypothetical protein